MTRIVKLPCPTEADDQIKLVAWLAKKGIRCAASANGGKRSMLEAIRFKRMGVSAGFPDITIPYPVGHCHGLYIELKRANKGVISEAQLDWLNFLRQQGYHAVVANGLEEAKKVVDAYFDGSMEVA